MAIFEAPPRSHAEPARQPTATRSVAVLPEPTDEVLAAVASARCRAAGEDVAAADALAILPGGGAMLRPRRPVDRATRQVVVAAATSCCAAYSGADLTIVTEPGPATLPVVPEQGYLARLQTFAHGVAGWHARTAVHLKAGGFLLVEADNAWLITAGQRPTDAAPSLPVLAALAACYLEPDLDVRRALASVSRHVETV